MNSCRMTFCLRSRWDRLRATEGWAALQHHSVLHTTLTVVPPRSSTNGMSIPRMLFQLTQGTYFTVLPKNFPENSPGAFVPEWQTGNVYAMHRSTENTVDMRDHISRDNSTAFDVFISGDYEVSFPTSSNSRTLDIIPRSGCLATLETTATRHLHFA